MGNGHQKAGKVTGGGGESSAAAPTATSQQGQELVQFFEGCELTAYKLKGEEYFTIGFGHYGPDVHEGQQITQAVANQLLRDDLQRFEQAVQKLITVPLTQSEFDACVSFAYNTGEGSLAESTFRKRINAGEDKPTCFREEFPKWVNGANGPLPGLVKRRDAEVKLAVEGKFP